MTFIKEIGLFEVGLIAMFAIFYGLYFWRVKRVTALFRTSPAKALYKFSLRVLYFALFVVAFLGPSFGEMKKEVKAISKDIYVCVDLSKSMDATDIQPSRLTKVKYEMKQIVKSLSSDRVGLIVFTNDAFMQCPLTYDANALGMFIETMSTNLISNRGTDFGPPLEMAIEKLKDADEGVPPSKQAAKIVVLISDGEDFGDSSDKWAQKLNDEGMMLITLGVGTKTGGKIPQGYRFQRDEYGNDVLSKLNPESLKNLASQAQGKYFEISDQRNDINRLISSIENVEGQMRSSREVDVAANKYMYFLGLALLLMLLDIMVPMKLVRI